MNKNKIDNANDIPGYNNLSNDMKELAKDIMKDIGSINLNDNKNLDFIPKELEASVINVEEINTEAERQAKLITERLSNFYFSEEYIKKHPYIPVKISSEMNNIRMLLKMLAADEKAQDALIKMCGLNVGNSRMFSSLTTIQSTMLNIQKQLNEIVERLEHIFLNMQKESGMSFDDSEKESDNGVNAIRGSRDFVKKCQEMAGLGNDNCKVNVSVEFSTVEKVTDNRNALEVAVDETKNERDNNDE